MMGIMMKIMIVMKMITVISNGDINSDNELEISKCKYKNSYNNHINTIIALSATNTIEP